MVIAPITRYTRTAVLAAMLGGWGGTALALPVMLQGTFSGFRGETLNISLLDEQLTDFEGADLLVTFGAASLTYTGISAGSLLGTSFVAANDTIPGEVTINVIPNAPVTGGPGTLVTLSFMIPNDAPFGQSSLTFATLDDTVYDMPPLTELITVNQRTPSVVSLPGTAALLLAGFVPLLGLARRVRRKG